MLGVGAGELEALGRRRLDPPPTAQHHQEEENTKNNQTPVWSFLRPKCKKPQGWDPEGSSCCLPPSISLGTLVSTIPLQEGGDPKCLRGGWGVVCKSSVPVKSWVGAGRQGSPSALCWGGHRGGGGVVVNLSPSWVACPPSNTGGEHTIPWGPSNSPPCTPASVFNPWGMAGGGRWPRHRGDGTGGGWVGVLTSCSPPQPCSEAAWRTPRAVPANIPWSPGIPMAVTAI